MASQKTIVIEHLFRAYWDESTDSLSKTLMSLADVAEGIQACNAAGQTTLSDLNPANFLKDFLRGSNANSNWPESVAQKRYTAVQRTGEGECFEFIEFGEGQTEPFSDDFAVRENAPRYKIQSISLPLTTKVFGRSDETWHIQTAINLRVVETHFAVAAAFPLRELTHLQIGIKLRSTEIDALFYGKYGEDNSTKGVLVTCEAKQAKDRIIPSQIVNQVKAVCSTAHVDAVVPFDMVVPIGLRTVKGVGFYLTEFEAVNRQSVEGFDELVRVSDAIYELHPPVKGI